MYKQYISSAVLLLASTLCVTAQAYANDQALAETPVFKRVPPAYEPDGLKWGGFIVKPQIEVETRYDDNIYSAETAEKSDLIVKTTPSISITKEYKDNAFWFSGEYGMERYAENDEEDQDTLEGLFGGLVRLTSRLTSGFEFMAAKSYLNRDTPGSSRQTARPVEAYTSSAEGFVNYNRNRLNLKFLGNVARKSYNDSADAATGNTIYFSDKNRMVYGGALETSYQLLKTDDTEHKFFTNFTYGKSIYDENSNALSANDYSEAGILAGFSTAYKGLLFGKVGVGYVRQDFKNTPNQNLWDIEVDLAYNITPKTTLKALAGRELKQDNSFVAGYLDTSYTLGVDHEFLHNLYGGASFTYSDLDFSGGQSTRQDSDYITNMYLKYYHNTNFESRLGWRYKERDSNTTGASFDNNIFMYSLTGKL